MNWYLAVVKNYAGFEGRARRKEFWMFLLFNALFNLFAVIIDGVLGIKIISTVYGLAILVPSLAVAVRRLHDIGKEWYWIFIGFIPLAGPIWLLILYTKEGIRGDNEFGQDPKTADEPAAHS